MARPPSARASIGPKTASAPVARATRTSEASQSGSASSSSSRKATQRPLAAATPALRALATPGRGSLR